MNNSTDSNRQSENDRRRFLKSCGRFAATVPPAMTVMLATSLTSNAIAKSTGGDSGVKRGGDRGAKRSGGGGVKIGGDGRVKHSGGGGGGVKRRG